MYNHARRHVCTDLERCSECTSSHTYPYVRQRPLLQFSRGILQLIRPPRDSSGSQRAQSPLTLQRRSQADVPAVSTGLVSSKASDLSALFSNVADNFDIVLLPKRKTGSNARTFETALSNESRENRIMSSRRRVGVGPIPPTSTQNVGDK